MTSKTKLLRDAWLARKRRTGLGTSAIEVIVALSLLTTTLTLSLPLVVRHGRLLTAQRHYRLALDELSNQLERLTALPEDKLAEALQRLAASPFTASRLPGVELSGQLEPADIGARLTLELTWDEPRQRAAPVALAAWIPAASQQPSGQTPRNEEP